MSVFSLAGCYLSQASFTRRPAGHWHAVMEISDQAWELNQMMGCYTIVNTEHHSCDITVVMSNGILTEETLFEGKDLKLNCVKLFSLTRILSSFQLNTYHKRIQIISYIGR